MPRGMVRLLEVDPDLAAELPAAELTHARRVVTAQVVSLAPGRWNVEPESAAFGHLVLDGLLVADTPLAGRVATQLLGTGDVIMRGPEVCALVGADRRYTVAQPAHVAVLDERFLTFTRRWPELGTALLTREQCLVERAAMHHAISQLPRVEDRIVAVLWLFAERWGRVTPNGIVVPLTLTHEVLGRLIGARRPTVTLALGTLAASQLLLRRADGTWLMAEDSRRVVDGMAEEEEAPADVRLAVDRPAAAVAPVAAGVDVVDRVHLARRVAHLRSLHPVNVERVRAALATSSAARRRSAALRRRG